MRYIKNSIPILTAILLFISCDDEVVYSGDVQIHGSIAKQNEGDLKIIEISLWPVNNSGSVFIPFKFSGSATENEDFIAIPNPVEIKSGETSATITIQAIDDNVIDQDESISMSIDFDNLQSGIKSGGSDLLTWYIQDND